ncbi:MAG: RNase adaptor protein RapZ, partial [Actinobacteria bacterium]|nr:RNase adaptor protein RapZ [Actinomycetota bacterium]
MELTIITGLSGAGKSGAMGAFEDADFFCIDNLPPQLLPSLVDLFRLEGSSVERAALV